jgi:hypothetical protein
MAEEGAPGPEGEPPVGPAAPAAAPPLPWALASFHATTLTVAGVLSLHAVGALGSLLQGVGTATGLGLYLALWGITWWTNRRWVADAAVGDRRGTVVSGARWGAVTGVGFLLAVLVAVAAAVPEAALVAVLALLGAPVSAVVGAVVGAAFAGLDLAVLAAGRRVA